MKGILHYIDSQGVTWEISNKASRWFAIPQTDGIMESGVSGIMVTAWIDGAHQLIEQIDERE
jgi:hypothetical protein